MVLNLQVLRSVGAGGGEHSGVNINLTERQPVTPEISFSEENSRQLWAQPGNLANLEIKCLLCVITKAGPVFKNISGGVAGITVGVDVIQGSEVADRNGEPPVVSPDYRYF